MLHCLLPPSLAAGTQGDLLHRLCDNLQATACLSSDGLQAALMMKDQVLSLPTRQRTLGWCKLLVRDQLGQPALSDELATSVLHSQPIRLAVWKAPAVTFRLCLAQRAGGICKANAAAVCSHINSAGMET